MDKKKFWLIVGIAAALLAVVIGVLCWLFWPGFRVVGDRLYVDVQETGFIFDPKTGELLGQTPVTVTGTAKSAKGGVFDGEVLVLGYQNEVDGVVKAEAGTETTDDGWVVVHYLESCTHNEVVEFENGYKPENDVTKQVTHICNYYYTVCLYPENKDFAAVEVGHYYDDTLVYVICADNEAEARENYNWYVKNR